MRQLTTHLESLGRDNEKLRKENRELKSAHGADAMAEENRLMAFNHLKARFKKATEWQRKNQIEVERLKVDLTKNIVEARELKDLLRIWSPETLEAWLSIKKAQQQEAAKLNYPER